MADRSPPEFPLLERLGRASMRPAAGAVKSRLRDDLRASLVVHGDRIHRAGVARAQQARALHTLRFEERRDRVGVEAERLGRFLQAIAEPDALLPVDHDAEPLDDPFVETHISSRPSSLRAVSMTTGVISPMPRSLA